MPAETDKNTGGIIARMGRMAIVVLGQRDAFAGGSRAEEHEQGPLEQTLLQDGHGNFHDNKRKGTWKEACQTTREPDGEGGTNARLPCPVFLPTPRTGNVPISGSRQNDIAHGNIAFGSGFSRGARPRLCPFPDLYGSPMEILRKNLIFLRPKEVDSRMGEKGRFSDDVIAGVGDV